MNRCIFIGGLFASLFVPLWLLFYRVPLSLATGINILFPWVLALWVISKAESSVFALGPVFFLPSIALFVTSSEMHIAAGAMLLIIGIAVVCSFAVAMKAFTRDRCHSDLEWRYSPFAVRAFSLASAIGFMVLQITGSILLANGVLPQGSPRSFATTVKDKYLYYGRGGYHFRFVLAPWGPLTTTEDVPVPRSVYLSVKSGGTVCVSLYPGALGMEWHAMSVC